MRRLEALGVRGEQYGMFLTHIMRSELPHSIPMEWACDSEEHESDLAYLLSFFESEIKWRERSSIFSLKEPSANDQEVSQQRKCGASCAQCSEGKHKLWCCRQLLQAKPAHRDTLI